MWCTWPLEGPCTAAASLILRRAIYVYCLLNDGFWQDNCKTLSKYKLLSFQGLLAHTPLQGKGQLAMH